MARSHLSMWNFSYPSRKDFPVLKDISFDVKPGEQVAIVEPSGRENLRLPHYYCVYTNLRPAISSLMGKITAFDLADYRSQIALVPQDIILFGGTIMENIRYGKVSATDEEVIEAAKKRTHTSSFPHSRTQYETLVGERGTKLSGGQRQRIAIARAMLSDPVILLLDEATSSLDSESEKAVQEALEILMAGRTSLVIAHRLSTIRNAHKIIVLDQGHVREFGTHDELMNVDNGLYRYLSSLQFNYQSKERENLVLTRVNDLNLARLIFRLFLYHTL